MTDRYLDRSISSYTSLVIASLTAEVFRSSKSYSHSLINALDLLDIQENLLHMFEKKLLHDFSRFLLVICYEHQFGDFAEDKADESKQIAVV